MNIIMFKYCSCIYFEDEDGSSLFAISPENKSDVFNELYLFRKTRINANIKGVKVVGVDVE